MGKWNEKWNKKELKSEYGQGKRKISVRNETKRFTTH